jgi:SAM-dependent methyltransferase
MNRLGLLEALEALKRKTACQLLSGLEDRKLKELSFHNEYRSMEQGRHEQEKSWIRKDRFDFIYKYRRRFYDATRGTSGSYLYEWIERHSRGKIFLDYACGTGGQVIQAAKDGAELAIGLDLSEVSIRSADMLARGEGVAERTFFLQADCENTGLPDECVDTILCSGVLHHLDIISAFRELRRILKPGGFILALEPLNYNPFIKLFRRVTHDMRTEWEKDHILSYRDIESASRYFEVKDIRHWNLFTICGAFFPSMLPFLNRLDEIVLKIPVVKLMSWMVSFEMYKRQ